MQFPRSAQGAVPTAEQALQEEPANGERTHHFFHTKFFGSRVFTPEGAALEFTPFPAKASGCNCRARSSTAENNLGAGRLTASLTTANLRCFTALSSLHPGRLASASISRVTASEWLDANTSTSGCNRTISSRLICGQSCVDFMIESAPACSSASAIKVCLPTEISGSVQTTKRARVRGTFFKVCWRLVSCCGSLLSSASPASGLPKTSAKR